MVWQEHPSNHSSLMLCIVQQQQPNNTLHSHINVVRLIQRTAPHQLRLSTRIITYHIVLSYANIWITHTHNVSSSITITQKENASPRKWMLYNIRRSLQGYVTDPVERERRTAYNVLLGRSFFTTNKEISEWTALSAH